MRICRGSILTLCILVSGCHATTGPATSASPDAARFITDDIPRFWTAFDKIQSGADTIPLRRDYLDAGTRGLEDFTAARWKNATTLTKAVWARRQYYASIRSNTLNVQLLEPDLRKVYRALDNMTDNPVFPDVYFAIGAMATGGTTSNRGLLIGTELFSLAPASPMTELTAWERSVVRPATILPAIVAHELTHYQQKYSGATQSLLGQSIREGCADFVGELLSGLTINATIRAYGDAHQAELWQSFKSEMHGNDVSRWLYNGGSVTSASDPPADLGYYVGSRICAAYYNRAADKREALREIFTIRDFDAFVTASGYSGS